MDLKDIIKAEIERTMREKLNETVEVEFSIGQDKIVAKTAISYSLNDIEYSTDSSNEAIKDIVKELNVNYEEPINFMFFKYRGRPYLMINDITYFGYSDGEIYVLFSLDYADPVFPGTIKVDSTELKEGDWVMLRNDITGFALVYQNALNILQNDVMVSVNILDQKYTKLIF